MYSWSAFRVGCCSTHSCRKCKILIVSNKIRIHLNTSNLNSWLSHFLFVCLFLMFQTIFDFALQPEERCACVHLFEVASGGNLCTKAAPQTACRRPYGSDMFLFIYKTLWWINFFWTMDLNFCVVLSAAVAPLTQNTNMNLNGPQRVLGAPDLHLHSIRVQADACQIFTNFYFSSSGCTPFFCFDSFQLLSLKKSETQSLTCTRKN